MPVLMFESWVLNEIWIIDLSSALVWMLHVMSSSKLFLFSNKPTEETVRFSNVTL